MSNFVNYAFSMNLHICLEKEVYYKESYLLLRKVDIIKRTGAITMVRSLESRFSEIVLDLKGYKDLAAASG